MQTRDTRRLQYLASVDEKAAQILRRRASVINVRTISRKALERYALRLQKLVVRMMVRDWQRKSMIKILHG